MAVADPTGRKRGPRSRCPARRTLSLLSSRAEMRGLDAERERAEPRSLAASRVSAAALSVLWLPVFLSPRRHEEGDSSLGSSGLLKRLASYEGRRERGPLASALESGRPRPRPDPRSPEAALVPEPERASRTPARWGGC